LLAHLDPMTAGLGPMTTRVTAGQQIGTTSSANHTHWEVRSQMVPDFAAGQTNFDNNADPIGWLSTAALGLGTILVVGGAAVLLLLLRRRSS
jgi:murein DD-endopeptidase MepM/ murein hydrolase activator NlpD